MCFRRLSGKINSKESRKNMTKENLIIALVSTALAWGFVWYYSKTRKTPAPKTDRAFLLKLGGCFLFALLCAMPAAGKLGTVLMILIFLIADIDILIGKIPTELLAALVVLILVSRIPSIGLIVVIVLVCAAVWVFRAKIGVAPYDILLFGALGMLVPDAVSFIRYTAVSLILWGVGGLILRAWTKGKARTIPLAPVFTFALLIENFLR